MTSGSNDWLHRVQSCSEKMRKAKAQLELTLAIIVSDNNNKKVFFKYVNSKRSKENVGLGVDGHLRSKEEEKAEICNAFFCLCIY